MQVDQGNRGYYPFGMGSAKNPFAQEDRKEAFNAYGTRFLGPSCANRYPEKGESGSNLAGGFYQWRYNHCDTLALLSGDDCLAGFETEPNDATPFHGVNKWPLEEDLPGFQETMEEYHKEMSCIANR